MPKLKPFNLFLEDCLKLNKYLKAGVFELLTYDPDNNRRVLTKDKYGICSVLKINIRKNFKPSIETALNKNDYFKNRAEEIYEKYYDYSLIDYTNNYTKIKIICPIHGIFFQTPQGHISGRGCFYCKNNKISKARKENPTGWSLTHWIRAATKSKYFDSYKTYIIKCWNENESFYKIGRTFTTLKQRFRDKRSMPYKFEILKIKTSTNPQDMLNLEAKLKDYHKNFIFIPQNKFHGMYECFSEINIDIINELCKGSIEIG